MAIITSSTGPIWVKQQRAKGWTTSHWQYPLSMFCWFRLDSTGGFPKILTFRAASGGRQGIAIDNAENLDIYAQASGYAETSPGGTVNVNEWTPAIGVFRDDGTYIDLYAWMWDSDNGNTSSSNTAGTSRPTLLGEFCEIHLGHDAGEFLTGKLAECAVWNNYALSAAEVSLLLAGYSPAWIAPSHLFSYMPLIDASQLFDTAPHPTNPGGDFVITGTLVTYPHPRIVYPPGFNPNQRIIPATVRLPDRRRYFTKAGAPPAGDPMPMAMHYYRTRRSG